MLTCVGSRGIVLVLERDEEQIKRISRVLETRDLSVVACRDGLEGIEVFNALRDRIVLVVLSMQLETLTGVEVLENLKQERPDIPVLAMHYVIGPDHAQYTKERGFDGCVQKPIHEPELVVKVETTIDRGFEESASIGRVPTFIDSKLGEQPCWSR